MCVAADCRGGPCRCSNDTLTRAESAERAYQQCSHDMQAVVEQLEKSPATKEELLARRPDLAATIERFYNAGFDMRIVDDLHDPAHEPMLVIGGRSADQSTRAATPTAPAAAPTPRSTSRTVHPSKETTHQRPANGLPDPTTYDPRSPEGKLQRRIEKRGGVWEQPALFDQQGQPVPAKRMDTSYGPAWAVFGDPSCRGDVVAWVNDSKAVDAQARVNALWGKGYQVGTVLARSQAVPDTVGRKKAARAVRVDGGYDPNAKIVEAFTADHYPRRA